MSNLEEMRGQVHGLAAWWYRAAVVALLSVIALCQIVQILHRNDERGVWVNGGHVEVDSVAGTVKAESDIFPIEVKITR